VNGTAIGRLRSITPATLIVDPPAPGLSANMRKAIVEVAPPTLIYVSCNPATLARDLKELRENFTIESVTPLDMFPQTAEIEVAAHLRAVPPKHAR
jgi:23S rRNA (uracil1939-C5)-methyltransferase